MHAIVSAGGAPAPKDSLFHATQGSYKAMLDIHGKPMIQWVLDALSGSQKVERVIVVGLPANTNLRYSRDLVLVENQGSMLANFRAGVKELQKNVANLNQVLAISSDIPAITPEMVDWMVERVLESDVDVYYNVIRREVMEARFPGSHRSFIHLKDMDVCGGDFNALRASAVLNEKAVYNRLIEARKSALRQASILGLDLLFSLLAGRLSLADAEKKATQRLGVAGKVLVCPYPEMGMDVDKPHQLAMMRAYFARSAPQRVI